MKKKIVLSAATIAAVITPLATVVACGNKHLSLGYDETKTLVTWGKKTSAEKLTGKQLFDKEESLEAKFSNDFSDYKKQALFVLYNKEVEAARPLQLSKFKYERFLNNLELSRLTTKKVEETAVTISTTGTAAEKKAEQSKKDEAVKVANDALKSHAERIKKLADKIKKLEDSKWKETVSFDSKYPILLKPYDKIRKDQKAIFQDRKQNWNKNIDPKQKAEGWPAYLKKTFGGAVTDEEGIIFLVNNAVAADAIKSTQFKINNEFSYKEYTFSKFDTKSFKFLKNAHTKGHEKNDADPKEFAKKELAFDTKIKSITTPKLPTTNAEWKTFTTTWDDSNDVLSQKVYFISSKGKIVKPLGMEESKFVSDISQTGKLIKVQHGIIPFIRSETNPDEPWKIGDADLKKLLYTYGSDAKGKAGYTNYFDGQMFGTSKADKKFTTLTLHIGKADGTSDIQGSLGIKTSLEYVKTMVPGFGLALLQKEGDTKHPTPITDFPNAALKTNIDAALADLYKKYKLSSKLEDTTYHKNKKIDSLFTVAKDEVIKQIGLAVRDTFAAINPGKKQELIYKVGKNHIVVSKFGIHLIHITEYAKNGATSIGDLVKTDFDKMAKDQNQSSSTGIVSLANAKYSKNDELLKYIQADKDLNKLFLVRLLDFNKKTKRTPDKILTEAKLKQLILRVQTVQKTKVIGDAIDSKIKWVSDHLDNELIDKIITPDKIYEWAVEAGGK